MKNHLIPLALLAACAGALMPTAAAAPAGDFAEHKAKMVARIQERIAKEQTLLACVQAAQNPEAIKACRPEGKEGTRPH